MNVHKNARLAPMSSGAGGFAAGPLGAAGGPARSGSANERSVSGWRGECQESGSALLHRTLERADLLLEIAELTSKLGQAAWLDLGLGELGVHRGSFGQQ